MNDGTYQNFGYTDWCLPNINEIESLTDKGRVDPTLSQGHPFTSVQFNYWSSTTVYNNINKAWYIWLGSYGYIGQNEKDTLDYIGMWPVRSSINGTIQLSKTGQNTSYSPGDDGDLQRGVAWPDPRFTDHDDGTVTDNLTGLMWTKDANLSAGALSWQQALDYVAGMNDGAYQNFGYTDWSLPNRSQLRSLLDYSVYLPVLPSDHPFSNVQWDDGPGSYWTSTSASYYDPPPETTPWTIFMRFGFIGIGEQFDSYVWPVRGGQ
jgi:hypothetical protein